MDEQLYVVHGDTSRWKRLGLETFERVAEPKVIK